MNKFITSEFVGTAHPDKLADLISDSILTYCLNIDINSRVACETLVKDDYVVLGGEITTEASMTGDVIYNIVKDALISAGYNYEPKIINLLNKQSADIALGTNNDVGGAGDQGIMFGYASNETSEYMQLEYAMAKRIIRLIEEDFDNTGLGPDIKSQVTTKTYTEHNIKRVYRVLVSVQHPANMSLDEIKDYICRIVDKVLDSEDLEKDEDYELLVNPTGRFVIGGPFGDSGVTGRKIVVDQYGGAAQVGGGAFSGKDPSKVDRSAAYMCRYLAKNIVASGIANECLIEISYAIGIRNPLSLNIKVDTDINVEKLTDIIRNSFDLTPKGIISYLQLLDIDYSKVCFEGHYGYGCELFPWEKINLFFVNKLKEEFND